ncbi:MAG: hypothetical protein IJB32_04525 [Clostridia bacterium]|nr:hypothetical protein [Clostridia bacterium]
MENNNEKLEYSYSAPTEEEKEYIKSIRRQYVSEEKETSKFEQLKMLNNKVNNPPTIVALIIGIIGLLIFGTGMTMVLEWALLVWGIAVSAVGAIPILISYPIYKSVLKKRKEKYGDEILRLSEELLGDEI